LHWREQQVVPGIPGAASQRKDAGQVKKPRIKHTNLCAPLKITWRNYPDSLHAPFKRLPCGQSLRPNLKVMEDYVAGSSVACAIVASWNPALFYARLIRVEKLAA
jgi:hypothetical protein